MPLSEEAKQLGKILGVDARGIQKAIDHGVHRLKSEGTREALRRAAPAFGIVLPPEKEPAPTSSGGTNKRKPKEKKPIDLADLFDLSDSFWTETTEPAKTKAASRK